MMLDDTVNLNIIIPVTDIIHVDMLLTINLDTLCYTGWICGDSVWSGCINQPDFELYRYFLFTIYSQRNASESFWSFPKYQA